MVKIFPGKLVDYNDPESLVRRMRAKRLAKLLALIDRVYEEKGEVRLIDLGGTAKYWSMLPEEYYTKKNLTVTLVNLPRSGVPEDYGCFRFIQGDACELRELADQSFDIVHSNSVIEHVGDWSRMMAFAREVKRLGRAYYVQTPNYWFPIEPHCLTPFFHWLPEPLRVWLVMHFRLGHWKRAASVGEAVSTVQSARMINRKMFAFLFDDAQIQNERFMLMAKSFVAIRQ